MENKEHMETKNRLPETPKKSLLPVLLVLLVVNCLISSAILCMAININNGIGKISLNSGNTSQTTIAATTTIGTTSTTAITTSTTPTTRPTTSTTATTGTIATTTGVIATTTRPIATTTMPLITTGTTSTTGTTTPVIHIHNFGAWVLTTEPSAAGDGEKTRTCPGCGATETKPVPYVQGSEGLEFTSNRDGTCYVSGIGICTDTEIVIPYVSSSGDIVTGIGNRAFDSSNATSITIPDGVTEIGNYAFSSCTSLVNINIPSSVEIIGNDAFVSSPGVIITEGDLKYVDKWLIICDHYATNVTLRSDTVGIINEAFMDCDSLRSITIPASVEHIGYAAFYECSALRSINVDIANQFYHSDGDCLIETASKTLVLGCYTSTMPSDGSVTSIADYAFSGCTELTDITIPNCVTNIGIKVFGQCTKLTNITIPDGVTSIEESLFADCFNLAYIVIPDSVTSIGDYAFYFCNNLTNIYYTGTATEWSKISVGSYSEYLTNATRYYYSETAPAESGNFWHYVDGTPTIWQ